MSQKPFDYRTKVTILLGLIGVLSLSSLLGWVFSQQAMTQRQTQEPLLAGFSAQAVESLQIGSDLTLTKKPTWNLTYQGQAYPAASDRIDTYLKTLATLQRDRLVTQEGGAAFGLEKDFHVLKILGVGGKVLYELQVGSATDRGDKVYVRLAGQKEIWETNRNLSRPLDLDFNNWADLSLFPGKTEADLTRVAFDSRIETADKTVYGPFDLVKTNTGGKVGWEDRLTKTSTEGMANWVRLVASFRFGAFATPSSSPFPEKGLGTLTVTWADGTSTVVKIGPSDDQGRYQATDGPRRFWINDWALSQLLYK